MFYKGSIWLPRVRFRVIISLNRVLIVTRIVYIHIKDFNDFIEHYASIIIILFGYAVTGVQIMDLKMISC
jgi:hypothetical protein